MKAAGSVAGPILVSTLGESHPARLSVRLSLSSRPVEQRSLPASQAVSWLTAPVSRLLSVLPRSVAGGISTLPRGLPEALVTTETTCS